nr:MAG TPA: hypothetical protein [Caudoviricetes sp.]
MIGLLRTAAKAAVLLCFENRRQLLQEQSLEAQAECNSAA